MELQEQSKQEQSCSGLLKYCQPKLLEPTPITHRGELNDPIIKDFMAQISVKPLIFNGLALPNAWYMLCYPYKH